MSPRIYIVLGAGTACLTGVFTTTITNFQLGTGFWAEPFVRFPAFGMCSVANVRWFEVYRAPGGPRRLELKPGTKRLRRAPARKCFRDAARWKRRRFVQGLT